MFQTIQPKTPASRLDALVPNIIEQKARLSRARGRKLVLKKPPKPRSIKGVERAYVSDLFEFLRSLKASVSEILLPVLSSIVDSAKNLKPKADSARADDYVDQIDEAMRSVRIQSLRRYTPEEIARMAKRAADRANEFNEAEFDRTFGAVLDINIARVEPWLEAEMKAFTKNNVSLISSIRENYLDRVEQTVVSGIQSGKLTSDLTEEIQKAYDVSESRAALIARDQIGKFNGNLNQARQTDVGVTKYTWSTSLDDRVRPDHAEKEGNVYSWNDPPADTGHPGQDYQCRCSAIPFFDPAPSASAEE